jgi:calmodulin
MSLGDAMSIHKYDARSVDEQLDREDELQQLFAQADDDSDLAIDILEFKSMMRDLDGDMSAQEAEIGFREIDIDHDGKIDFAEFRAWWRSN